MSTKKKTSNIAGSDLQAETLITCKKTLKQLTGGDLMQANVKYKQSFTFVNEATVVFVSNYPLQLPHDPALESRLVTIPFTTSIPKERQVPNFSELLYQERGYIVGQVICALRNLVDRGFVFTRADSVARPQRMRSTAQSWIKSCGL